MAQNDEAVRKTVLELREGQRGPFAGYCLAILPVERHLGREYAIESRRKTEAGFERLDAIDLTGFDNHGTQYAWAAARVDAQGEPDPYGGHVAAVWPDEGSSTLITQDGQERQYRPYCKALSADPSLESDLMDELEQHVDAGGKIGF